MKFEAIIFSYAIT